MSDPTVPSGGHPVPDAGWYPDPAGGDGTRWWDGKGWTNHVQPGPSGFTATPVAADPTGPVQPFTPLEPAPPAAGGGAPFGGTPAGGGAPGAGAIGGPEVPWWAQTNDGAPPSWWSDAPTAAPTGRPSDAPFTMPAPTHPGHRPNAEGAVKALVLGLISLVCCGILIGPWAIYTGSQARFRIRVSNGRLGGEGFAIAGMVLGGISVLLFFYSLWLFSTGRAHLVHTTTNG